MSKIDWEGGQEGRPASEDDTVAKQPLFSVSPVAIVVLTLVTLVAAALIFGPSPEAPVGHPSDDVASQVESEPVPIPAPVQEEVNTFETIDRDLLQKQIERLERALQAAEQSESEPKASPPPADDVAQAETEPVPAPAEQANDGPVVLSYAPTCLPNANRVWDNGESRTHRYRRGSSGERRPCVRSGQRLEETYDNGARHIKFKIH